MAQVNQQQPHIQYVPVGIFQANCYLSVCPRTREAALIDPGAEPETILEMVRRADADVRYLLLTHGHPDHIGAVDTIYARYPVPLAIHEADIPYLTADQSIPGLVSFTPLQTPPTLVLHDGDEISFGDIRLRVLHTPGHTPGSVCFIAGQSAVFSGDTLFHRGIGRTDLPGGNTQHLFTSIRERVYALPAAMRVYPGHGPATSIGEEQQLNPFVRVSS
jgi:hydroxyacylglutathione hydrolase